MSGSDVPEAVAAEIRRLSQGALVEASFDDGVLTLQGEVADAERRRLIEQGLLLLREVEDVRNFLRVAPPPGDLAQQLRGVLAREGVQIPDLQIDARDGELTLRGHAQGWFDRDAAERLAWTLPGVRQVANRIELPPGAVEPEPPTGDGRIV